MEQGVPGSQNEPFFELLHPKSARAPSSSSIDSATDGSPTQDPLSLHDIPPSYDFHLTHSSKSSDAAKPGNGGAKSEDSPPFLYRGSSLESSDDHHHTCEGSTIDAVRGPDHGKPMEVTDARNQVTMAAIDRTMKNYSDNLLHVLESVSGRLSQLETTVQGLEHTIAGLKSAEGEKQDQSNGKLLKLEQLIEEVRTGIQLLHEKQRLDETNSQLTKLHLDDKPVIAGASQPSSDVWQQPRLAKEEAPQVAYSEPPQQLAQHLPPQYPSQAQSHYPHAPPPPSPQMQAFAASQIPSSMNRPSNPSTQQPYPPTVQHLPAQPSMQQVSPPAPQHSMPISSFHSQPPPPPPPQPQSSYNLAMETAAYDHMQPQHHHPAPPPPPSSTYLPEPPQYTAGAHGGPRQQPMPQEVVHPSQQHSSVGPQHMYESIGGRMGHTASSMPPSYAQLPAPKPAPPVSMYETASGGGYGTPPYRGAQPVPSAPSGGGASYPRLPTAQPVQHASTGVSSGPSTRSPLDEVIERVVSMGFSREQVRVVVRQLTENGQSVELNVVLDKLMNGGDSPQNPRSWYRRG